MKTTRIIIDNYKDNNLQEAINELYAESDMSDDEYYDTVSLRTNNIFKYGEYLSAEIIIDENLNIVGGKIIPFKPY